jgi:membrane protease YdiL (CAAX protease family)
MAWVERGKTVVQALLERLLLWQVGIHWYAFVLLSTPLMAACAVSLYCYFMGESLHVDVARRVGSRLSILPVLVLLGGPMPEELGWRGFALPKLLSEHSALGASMIVGVMWGLWHWPAFWVAGAGQHNQPILWFMLGAPPMAILYTWVFNHTRGSLLIAVLYHAAFDSTLYLALPAFPTPKAIETAFRLMIALLWVTALVVVALAPQRLSRDSEVTSTGL